MTLKLIYFLNNKAIMRASRKLKIILLILSIIYFKKLHIIDICYL